MIGNRFSGTQWLWTLAVLAGVGLGDRAIAASSQGSACCSGEFWVIMTRGRTDHERMCVPIERFGVQRLEGCRWRRSSMSEYLATSGQLPTIIHIHGNGLSHKKAMEYAWMLRNGLKGQASTPFRFVLWSWPADTKRRGFRGLFKRFNYHSRQAESEGYHVARVIARMQPNLPIGFTGHSLGAVGTVAALHALGGGHVRGFALAEPMPLPHDARGAVFGAAVDNDAILPGRRASQALKGGRLLLMKNPCDSMLPRWPKISDRGRPAMGLTGVPCPHLLGDDIHRLTVVNSGRHLGKGHGSKDHFTNCWVLRTLADYFLTPRPEPQLERTPAVELKVEANVETEVEAGEAPETPSEDEGLPPLSSPAA